MVVFSLFGTLMYLLSSYVDVITDTAAELVKENFYLSTISFLVVFVFTSICLLPTMSMMPVTAIIYTKVFNDSLKGFLISTTVCFTGMMLGSAAVFYISRKCIRSRVVKMVENNKGNKKWVRNIKLIDSASFTNFC